MADDEAFANAKRLNTAASYQAYLDRGGRHAAEARKLQSERARAEEAERRRADEEAATRARHAAAVAGYQEYLSSHPKGRHAEEIRGLLAEALKKKWPSGKEFRDCKKCPKMVVVPAGSFMMGSTEESPNVQHRVTISLPFAVGIYEVTRKEWSRFVSETNYSMERQRCFYDNKKSWRKPGFRQTGRHPVVCVNWTDASNYVEWLSKKTGKPYRLLSESEWEYTARGGTTSRFHFGSKISMRKAHYNGRRTYRRRGTVKVGSFPSNAFGVHDVHGNVSEWVEDCWSESYSGAPADGSAWTEGPDCKWGVSRGGDWNDFSHAVTSSVRKRAERFEPFNRRGFRVARTLD